MQGYWRVGTVVLAAMLAALPVAADQERGLDYNLVRLEADAAAEVPNDLMRVTLAVEHNARDAAALPPLVNADMRWALDLAKQRPSVKAQSGEYTTQPEYAAGRIVGWRAIQVLELESEDFAEVTALATELQQKLQVRAMEFAPTRATRLRVENELTAAALRAFAAKAKLITETMGAARYEVVEVNVGGTPVYKSQRGAEMAMMRAADAAAPPIAVEGGTATLTVTVNGQIQLR
jgi:predicted secreted protein